MGQVAVRLKNVSKRFLLDREVNRTVMEIFVHPFRRKSAREYFWPLRDVSFELERGKSLGIIGENGSGKSTILKLIAHILEPTSGMVEIHGQVSALLELGASFHPELTGRENIFLAASIASIGRAEINRQLDNIIKFADIGPYIDVPVKHYSSGMYVRLGFAVAVHLQPEILIVDEVLAVGDEAFQHKCLQTIKRLQRHGVSVVLVSHGMEQITDLCDTALWLHDGYIRSYGKPARVISDYLSLSSEEAQGRQVAEWTVAQPVEAVPTQSQNKTAPAPIVRYERGAPTPEARRWGDQTIVIQEARLLGADGRPTLAFLSGDPMRIEFNYEIQRSLTASVAFGIAIYRSDQVWCYGTNTAIEHIPIRPEELPRKGTVTVELPVLQLLQGDYTLDVAVHTRDGELTYDYIRDAVSFYVKNPRGDNGIFRPLTRWSLQAAEEKVPG